MLYQIVSFLLDVAGGLLTGACLLRLYMQWQRVPFGNPVGRLVFALTDWLVLPLRRAVPAVRGIDWASLLAALLVQLVQYLVLWIILGAGAGWAWLPWLALFGLLRVAVSAVMGLVIVHAVMSWVQARSPIANVIDRLAEPILRPVRRLLPPLGGVDLSPLVLIVLLQVLLMVLGNLQISLWR
ncbi:YggT family protein [Simplicispira hankyongi]|uniref:YggT family protein n=1 Tax=Simplicispira hankyongi TaxID=2315688 RepID=A0A398CLW1_9BURK|nr:YggT family protein [Simplicispira hankyongi]MBU6467268.1 YggT family protein [Burkholderiales bacterium]RID99883.1 YggT family protein [Simplicispira hankyongi]